MTSHRTTITHGVHRMVIDRNVYANLQALQGCSAHAAWRHERRFEKLHRAAGFVLMAIATSVGMYALTMMITTAGGM